MENDFIKGTDELKQALSAYIEELKRQDEEIEEKYPLDVPNEVCNTAVITGIFIENSFEPYAGDFVDFFKVDNEKVYIWTHEEDENSVLAVVADEEVKNKKCWVTVAELIDLSRYLWTSFERRGIDDKLSYKWVYYFDPKIGIKNSTFYGMTIGGPRILESAVFHSGIVLKATDISEMAHILELLWRDEKAYTATAALKLSFQLHYCCLICETGIMPYHDHLSYEPEVWEHLSVIPEMEGSIVQACRSVEAILGEPPNRKPTKVYAFKERWKQIVGFDPDSIFEKGQISYLEFYYKLFDEFRNPSAHSYGNIHYDLLRKNTVEAQCFAAKVLFEYIKKNALDNEDAIQKLSFNTELLSRVSPKMSTKLTKQGAVSNPQ